MVQRVLVTEDTILEAIEDFARRVEDYEIPSDGLVLTYEDIAYGQSLGRTAKFPGIPLPLNGRTSCGRLHCGRLSGVPAGPA